MVTAEITPQNFPTPHLALRAGVDGAAVRGFARAQAAQARTIATYLWQVWDNPRLTTCDRVDALGIAYAMATDWRHQVAVAGTTTLGVGVGAEADRFRTPITDDSPNLDRLGTVGRFAEGAEWDPQARVYTGGTLTLANLVTEVYGDAVRARFAVEAPAAEVLENWVVLPDGSALRGNTLLRGSTARAAASDLMARVVLSGRDGSRMETGGDPVFTVTASQSARETMRAAAFALLACSPGDFGAWWQAAYLMYQAPRFKKGSDASTRVFLVAVGAVLLGTAPVLPHDLDLRCMVLGQTAATVLPQLCGVSA